MLTDSKVKSLKPGSREYTLSDDTGSRGDGRLIIRVRPSGTKTWEFRQFVGGRKRKKALGSYPAISLVKARQLAAQLRDEEPEDEPGTFGELMEAYVHDMRVRGKRTPDKVLALFEGYVKCPFPSIWNKSAEKVTPRNVSNILRHHIDRGVTSATNQLRSYISSAYKYGLTAEYNPRTEVARAWGLTSNPAVLVPRQADFDRQGDRVLTEEEIRDGWFNIMQTHGVGFVRASAIRLCIATAGQRPTGLIRLHPSHVDLDKRIIDQPGSITKNGKPHVIPLSQRAIDVIQPLHRMAVERDQDWIFANPTSDAHIGVDGLGKAIIKYRKRHGSAHWVLRDIRRTAKTVLGQQRVSKEMRDRLHGHALTDVSSRHYDRHDYLEEKREAMAVWDAWLDGVLKPEA